MKIGLSTVITEHTPDPGKLAKRCESLGIDAMFIGDHPIFPAHLENRPLSERALVVRQRANLKEGQEFPEYYAQFPDPFIVLTAAACATSRLKLGTNVCLVSEREPITLAKTVASLDLYSKGRFIFTIGTGAIPEESQAMGVAYRQRWAVARERIAAMKELWTKPVASFEGRFVRFPPVRCDPKPAQKPHPPIIIGAGGMGSNCLRALKDTVAMGDGWNATALNPQELAEEVVTLRQLCKEAGRDFNKLEISVTMPVEQGDNRRTLEEYSASGAHRLVFIVWPEGLKQQGIEDVARKYLN